MLPSNQFWDGVNNFSLVPQVVNMGNIGLSNVGLVLAANNSGAFTGGHPDNKMSVRTYYTIEPVFP